MTSLERALVSVLDAIEQATKAGDPRMLRTLLDRKRAICATLAAPEQAWVAPPAQVSDRVRRPRQSRNKVLMSALCG